MVTHFKEIGGLMFIVTVSGVDSKSDGHQEMGVSGHPDACPFGANL